LLYAHIPHPGEGTAWSTHRYKGTAWSTHRYKGTAWSTHRYKGTAWSTHRYEGTAWSNVLRDKTYLRGLFSQIFNHRKNQNHYKDNNIII